MPALGKILLTGFPVFGRHSRLNKQGLKWSRLENGNKVSGGAIRQSSWLTMYGFGVAGFCFAFRHSERGKEVAVTHMPLLAWIGAPSRSQPCTTTGGVFSTSTL